MKKKILIISIFVLGLTILACYSFKKNNNTLQDNLILAMTLDGKTINEVPDYNTNKYKVKVSCTNGIGKWMPVSDDTYKVVVEEVTGNVNCMVDFYTKTDNDNLVNVVKNASGIVNEGTAGYRYEGQNPNNYVWFNNELWRIIGSIPTCLEASCGTNGTNLVKIIRNTPIGKLAFDGKSSGYTSVWGNNTLFSILNNYYYGAKNATNVEGCSSYKATAKAKCDYQVYGIKTNGLYDRMIKSVYWNTGEGSSNSVASNIYIAEQKTQTVEAKIGIINLSDYAYATSATKTLVNTYDSVSQTENNWLFGQGSEWTNSSGYISTKGSSVSSGDAASKYYGHNIRPIVYLNESVYVSSGDGTISNPYILAM